MLPYLSIFWLSSFLNKNVEDDLLKSLVLSKAQIYSVNCQRGAKGKENIGYNRVKSEMF